MEASRRKPTALMKIVFEGDHLYVRERNHWQYVERKKAREAAVVIAETDDGFIAADQGTGALLE